MTEPFKKMTAIGAETCGPTAEKKKNDKEATAHLLGASQPSHSSGIVRVKRFQSAARASSSVKA